MVGLYYPLQETKDQGFSSELCSNMDACNTPSITVERARLHAFRVNHPHRKFLNTPDSKGHKSVIIPLQVYITYANTKQLSFFNT